MFTHIIYTCRASYLGNDTFSRGFSLFEMERFGIQLLLLVSLNAILSYLYDVLY